MNDEVTMVALEARLRENGLQYGVLALQNGVTALVVERGGRVLGPFTNADSASIFWTSPVLHDPAAFAAFLAANEWNLGGERIWIAPEIQYLIRDRNDFWGSLAFPAQMDPGNLVLDQPQPGCWRLRQDLTLTAHNLAAGQKNLHLERVFRPVADPLTNSGRYPLLLDGVTYAGYEQSVTLSEDEHDGIMSQAWNVVQLRPGGQLVVACSPDLEITDYMEPIDETHHARAGHWAAFQITGRRRYKVGLRAAHTFGRLAYFNPLANGRASLIVRNFFNNPSAPYVDEPPHLPGSRGDSIHIYNDGGMFGGFGELECHGQTIGGITGISSSRDQQLLWLYIGPAHQLVAIARHLLGATL